jgi:hypothetical protein
VTRYLSTSEATRVSDAYSRDVVAVGTRWNYPICPGCHTTINEDPRGCVHGPPPHGWLTTGNPGFPWHAVCLEIARAKRPR